jgi:tetratricopeptide (TPR) repeat protein
MKRMWPAAICLILLSASTAMADGSGTESPFSLGTGARDLALGGAAISTADAIGAPYWNPSVLARAERISFGAFHSRLFEPDVAYQYVGAVVPTMDMGSFGLGLFRLGIGGIEKRSASNYRVGEISNNRLALYLGYGRTVSAYDVGASVMMEYHSLDDLSATSSPGVNLAISRRFKPGLVRMPDITACISSRNLLEPGMKLEKQTVRQPRSFEAGVTVRLLPKPAWNHDLSISGSVSKVDQVEPRLAFGVEYSLQNLLHLRAGSRDGKPSFGIGLSYKSLTFDYALVDRDLGSLHMFSMKAAIGTPVDVKRRLRQERREAEFNRLISTRLADQNQTTVETLTGEGEALLGRGDLDRASMMLDRALFLAAGGGLDTTEVYRLAKEARERLEEERIHKAYTAHMDSARSKFAARDYLGARYFADLALAEVADSDQARELLDRVDAAIRQSITRDQMIASRLALADSLISYDKFDEALVTLKALGNLTGDDSRISRTIKKAEFGRWQRQAETEFDRGDYRKARAAVDSALARFPDHPVCLNLRSRIEQETRRASAGRVEPDEVRSEPLSPELREQVDEIYQSGQRLFKQGDLKTAVEMWEKVESLAPDYLSVREYLVNAYKYIGVELYTQNELEEAVATWNKAAALEPDGSEIASYIKRTESELAKLRELSYE